MPKNSNILLIRHGEKPLDPLQTDLSISGQARSMAYVVYFQNFVINSSVIKLDYLFATAPTGHSNRSFETIAPLAAQLKLKINNLYGNTEQNIAELVQHLLSQPQFDHSNILICWHHERLLAIADALGAIAGTLPTDWPPEVFGRLLLLSYDAGGRVISSTAIAEKLMYGDQATV